MTKALSVMPLPAVPANDSPQDNARMLKTLLANVDGMVYRCR